MPGDAGDLNTPPDDTGEAVGLAPGNLTITIGYGPALFDDRFGLAARRPSALKTLPHLPKENLDPDNSDGDLCVQACADDPQVAFHAVRNLRRLGVRHARAALDGTRLRPHLLHHPAAGHPAQPDGLQGRHPQHRRHRRRD